MSHAEAAFPGSNRFRVRGARRPLGRRVVEALRSDGGYFASSAQRREDFEWCDIVLVHWLSRAAARDLRTLPPQKALVWCCWGGDHYKLAPGPTPLLMAETRALAGPERLWALKRLFDRSEVPDWFRRTAPRIDRFCSILPKPPFTALAPMLAPRRLPEFPYYSETETFRQGPDWMEGGDILLGNSAAPENNHLDALTILSRLVRTTRRIVVPLSYGDPLVAEAVSERARQLFGDRALILRNWMPLADYNAMISRCGTTVMNHVRAQAVGNVASALYKGSKVYLHPESPLYAHFLDLGATVFAFDESLSQSDFEAPLDLRTQTANREAIQAAYSDEAIIRRIRMIVEDSVSSAEARMAAGN